MPGSGIEVRGIGARGFLALCLLGVLALAMMMAGCGVTTTTQGASFNGTPSASASSTATPGARPSPGATQTAIGESSAVSCPESSQDAGHPDLILTPTTSGRAGSAHVGDMVQVRLPTTTKWSYHPGIAAGPLSPAQPSGVLIRSLNACVWSFQAVTAGTQTLPFSGQAICKPGQPCPDFRIAMTFSVSVS